MKRRSFIRETLVGSMGIALGASASGLQSCSGSDRDKKVTMALIGCGARGTELMMRTCKATPEVELKYVCDVDDTRAGRFIQNANQELGFSPVHLRNMKEVFADDEVDAVMIATPDHWHVLATLWACQAGKDVYLEAVPCLTFWEGRKLVEIARKYKRIIQIGFQHRSANYCKSARDYIKEGKLGQIVHMKVYHMTGGKKWEKTPDSKVPEGLDWDAWLGPAPERPYSRGIHNEDTGGGWKNFWDFGGGALSQDAGHLLDMARMVAGDPDHPLAVYGCSGNLSWGSRSETPENHVITYDYGKFTLTCETGHAMDYMKTIMTDSRTGQQELPHWMRTSGRVEIYGTEGLMYLGYNGRGWQVSGAEEKIIALEKGINPDVRQCLDFVGNVRARKKPEYDAEQGHMSAALVHLGNIAYRLGNKQLIFDGKKEKFINDDAANDLLKSGYRDGYIIPKKV